MFTKIFKRANSEKAAMLESSICFSLDGTAQSVLLHGNGTHEFFSGKSDEVVQKMLSVSPSLKKNGVRIVLDERDFKVFPVEMPNVPDEAVRDALRWIAKEQSEFNMKELVFSWSVTPVPEGNGKRMAFIYCAKRQVIQERCNPFTQSGIPILSVSIPDESWKNLVSSTGSPTEALVTIGENTGKLMVIHDGSLLLSRRLPFGERIFDTQEGIERAVIDIQRGMDYIDRQYQKINIKKLLIAPIGDHDSKFQESLTDAVNCKVELADFSSISKKKSDVSLRKSKELELLGAAIAGRNGKTVLDISEDVFFVKKTLSKDTALLSIALSGIAAAILSYTFFFQAEGVKAERVALQERVEGKRLVLKTASEEKPNPVLEKSVSELEQQVDQMRETAVRLKAINETKSDWLEGVVKLLDESSGFGVYLLQINLAKDSISVVGEADNAEAIAKWKSNIGKAEEISGAPLKNIQVSTNGKTTFSFSSNPPEKSGGETK